MNHPLPKELYPTACRQHTVFYSSVSLEKTLALERRATGYERQRYYRQGNIPVWGKRGVQDPVAQIVDTRPNYGVSRKKKGATPYELPLHP